MIRLLSGLILLTSTETLSIWEVGHKSGAIPEVRISDITSQSFFTRYRIAPFVVRGFHKTLDQLAADAGFQGDSFDWLRETIGDRELISGVEGELQETRKAPTLPNVKWKYFFEAFRDVDMYAVSKAPRSVRQFLQILPYLACGGLSSGMRPPTMWMSGGVKSSRSVVHADSFYNQHCVLKGTKRFMLIPPFVDIEKPEFGWVQVTTENGVKPEGFEMSYGEFVAGLDPDNVDLDRMPGWKDVPWLYTELNAGDCIYMPTEWYHYVESNPEPTLTWHLWFNIQDEWDESDRCSKDMEWFPSSKCRYREDWWEEERNSDFWEAHSDSIKSICN